MALSAMPRTLGAVKKAKGLTCADCGQVIDRDDVWGATLWYRQATASPGRSAEARRGRRARARSRVRDR